MANFGEKNGIFYVRFRFLAGKEYKKLLKIRPRPTQTLPRCPSLISRSIESVTGQVVSCRRMSMPATSSSVAGCRWSLSARRQLPARCFDERS